MPRSFSKIKHTPAMLVLYAVLAGVGLMIVFVAARYAFSRDIRSVSQTLSATPLVQQATTTQNEPIAVSMPTSTAVAAPDLTHRPLAFDPTVRKIGWKTGLFTLVSIQSPYGEVSTSTTSEWYGATFSGKATVTGRYAVVYSDLAGDTTAYFVPDVGSLLPVDAAQGDDSIHSSFYLENTDKAVQLFGKSDVQGRATIEIDGYTLRVGGSEIGSGSKLVRVIQKLPSNNFDPSF